MADRCRLPRSAAVQGQSAKLVNQPHAVLDQAPIADRQHFQRLARPVRIVDVTFVHGASEAHLLEGPGPFHVVERLLEGVSELERFEPGGEPNLVERPVERIPKAEIGEAGREPHSVERLVEPVPEMEGRQAVREAQRREGAVPAQPHVEDLDTVAAKRATKISGCSS